MVERGHDDGCGTDEMVNYEYAKVRRLYDKLGIGDRTQQIGLVVDVGVERRGGDPEGRGDPAQRQPVEAVGHHDPAGGSDDRLPGEVFALGCHARHCTVNSVHRNREVPP